MHGARYVVLSQSGEWRILHAGHLVTGYPSKTDAMSAAIELAEKEGHAGREAEVLVRHEDGCFLTEWMFGHDLHADDAGRPIPMPGLK
jgi:hypothetical protein